MFVLHVATMAQMTRASVGLELRADLFLVNALLLLSNIECPRIESLVFSARLLGINALGFPGLFPTITAQRKALHLAFFYTAHPCLPGGARRNVQVG